MSKADKDEIGRYLSYHWSWSLITSVYNRRHGTNFRVWSLQYEFEKNLTREDS